MSSLKWSTAILSACLLMACQSSGKLSTEPTELPANLATPCPPVPQLRDGQSGTMLRWGAQLIELYATCQSRHKALVHAWPAR